MTCTKNALMPFFYFFGEIATFGAVVKKKNIAKTGKTMQ